MSTPTLKNESAPLIPACDASSASSCQSVIQVSDSTFPNPQGLTHGSHHEHHKLNTEILRDAIIGLADGLTVPFALAAGLSNLADNKLVVLAGFAELIAGSISMALGGYLASKSEIEHFDAERKREEMEIVMFPEAEEQEIIDIFQPYGLTIDEIEPILKSLKANPKMYVDFMMKFELNLEKPDPYRSVTSAATIGSAYFLGGIIPLLPYVYCETTQSGLLYSSILTLFTLFLFGIARAYFIGLTGIYKSAFQTMMIGTIAAAASYLMVSLTG
ncbi:Vacuolar iron transporter 1 [Smittium mucronatum]|uniref:Vacuolar iron transporter 1 n=1 Tax=Smittium mucronatum TaxID=133383 RepID=A0A1R0GW53_9FUNG|nr:Vacuolar iron transporter 1 [Smittium mucronatum]